ncbi:MAG: DUF4349 domain-containing protein [Lachnospiraceae bacterium]|nr:DUF4349 domain-containing protein [Lachnospiraceae bacterium]
MRKGNQLLGSLLLLLCFCTGCGSSRSDTAMSVQSAGGSKDAGIYTNSYAVEEAAAAEVSDMDMADAADQNTIAEESAVSTERKLIKEVELSVETENLEELLKELDGQIQRMGGYIESSRQYSPGWDLEEYGTGSRSASLTVRIPAEKLEEFLGNVAEKSNVTYRSENVRDVTLQYVDMESHKKALLTEQERLLDLMEQAENVEDIITIEGRLSEVRYQIESMESQLRTMDNQVNYSTVYLDISEVDRMLRTSQKKGVWEQISTGFIENIYRVGDGLRNFVIRFIIALPILAVWGVVIAAIVLIVRRILKNRRKKKELIETQKGQEK